MRRPLLGRAAPRKADRLAVRPKRHGANYRIENERGRREAAFSLVCAVNDVSSWHEAADQECPPNGRYRGQTGKHLLALSFSQFDPERTFLKCVGALYL